MSHLKGVKEVISDNVLIFSKDNISIECIIWGHFLHIYISSIRNTFKRLKRHFTIIQCVVNLKLNTCILHILCGTTECNTKMTHMNKGTFIILFVG